MTVFASGLRNPNGLAQEPTTRSGLSLTLT